MTLRKTVDETEIVISTDTEYLRKLYQEGKPVILLINSENKSDDTSFARYAIEMDEEDIDEISDILTEDYCRLVIARCQNKPLIITRTDRITVRELSKEDALSVYDMYNSGEVPFLEAFFKSLDEAREYLGKYIEEVYGFYGFGIWGIFETSDDKFIGLAGFSPRDSMDIDLGNESEYLISLEMGYALSKDYRKKGYAYEACNALLGYAKDNIEYSEIFVNINRDNKDAILLAKKLGLKIRIF